MGSNLTGSGQLSSAHRAHRRWPAEHVVLEREPRPWGDVRAATEVAITAATHLTDMDKGTVAALRVLADKVDSIAGGEGVSELDELKGKFDNVTLPTYLKYCEALGLTPSGRKAAETPPAKGGRPAKLASVSQLMPKLS